MLCLIRLRRWLLLLAGHLAQQAAQGSCRPLAALPLPAKNRPHCLAQSRIAGSGQEVLQLHLRDFLQIGSKPRLLKRPGNENRDHKLTFIIRKSGIQESADAGASNAHFLEGYSMAYRVKMTGLSLGAHSLVTHDVPDFALVFGVPAKLVRYVCPRSLRHSVDLADAVPRCGECGEELRTIVSRR